MNGGVAILCILVLKYEVFYNLVQIIGIGDEDPTARLDKIGARLEVITRLKRKYGQSVSEILSFREDAAKRLDEIENSDIIAEELEKKLSEKENEARALALMLREARQGAARILTERVTESLEFLDMPKVRFEVSVRPDPGRPVHLVESAYGVLFRCPGRTPVG